jgi:3-keto-disaccharide hydrolase
MKPASLFLALSLSLTLSAPAALAKSKAAPAPATPNTLTAKEKKDGWKLLFDGKSTKGWRAFKSAPFPAEHWVAKDGNLVCMGGKKVTDIVTEDQFDNFEFAWDWRMTPKGNSGLKYLVDENMSKKGNDGIGFEYQLLDDDLHPDAKKGKDGNRTAGSLYDLIPAGKEKVLNPVGEWNASRLLVDGNHIEHWLNGVKVVSFERSSPEMKARIADSKYKTIEGFGEVQKGHLLLQDHDSEVYFRNMKIRALKKK